MIRIKIGKNFLYLLVCIISYFCFMFIETGITITSSHFYFITLFMQFLSKIIGGLSIYLYQNSFFKKKAKAKYFNLELIFNKGNIESKDKTIIILLLIFFASIFDYFLYIMEYYYSTTIKSNISNGFKLRISSLITISSTLVCTYALKYKLGNHHKFSLIFLSLIAIIQIILEIYYNSKSKIVKIFPFELFLKVFRNVMISLTDCIEKYLYEVDYANPFKLLIYEGIFELIYAIIFCFVENIININEIKKLFKKDNKREIYKIIFLLIGFFLFSTIISIYRIYCNVIYSPIIKSLIDYLLAPFFNIFTFFIGIDFYKSVEYFAISETINIIISFFGCVHNEFIILSCFGLDHDTKFDIASRAQQTINRPNDAIILKDFPVEEDDNSEIRLTENYFD